MEVGGRGREIIYLLLHCHHQNDFLALRPAAMRAINIITLSLLDYLEQTTQVTTFPLT